MFLRYYASAKKFIRNILVLKMLINGTVSTFHSDYRTGYCNMERALTQRLSIYMKYLFMSRDNLKIHPHNQRRLEKIGLLLKEIRFSDGRNQDEYVNSGLTRRQIQRSEYGSNLTLNSLFTLLDCHGYRLDDFFEEME
jgi:hypothetical protein